ncbi:glycosyltransferase family 4 protein [Microbulbifer variabilis]|uniref:glycosyltransferase family 4 protein n=1 Tax=Microbulbifer variabilis TaxID=266805 RepID=UPI001CFEA85A|nr:glycosyltransferase family 1 protein [Microbulbifer variabilis]
MKILIATDTYPKQLNGVSRVLEKTIKELSVRGHEVKLLSVDDFKYIPLPGYHEIRVAIFPGSRIARIVDKFSPDAIHIMTEGPIGFSMRRYCKKRGLKFTTSWLSRLCEYGSLRYKIPVKWLHKLLVNFHQAAAQTMVTTASMEAEAKALGISRIVRWRRGVELDKFHPVKTNIFSGLPRPILLNVGRVAVEKSLDRFLSINIPGTKVVVGDGPQLNALKKAFPEAIYLGVKEGKELTECYSGADVFVFPSLTDTFGLVNLEALACGLPIAAYPVTGPRDIIGNAPVGAMDEDLEVAVQRALSFKSEDCIARAKTFCWDLATEDFISNLVPVNMEQPLAADY